jgi:predicted transglutaminase-like cysteine proteinase
MKKTLLLLCALFGLSSATSFADALLLTVNATPYDRQMERIRPALAASSHSSADQTSVAVINQWMSELRDIPYGYQMVWKTPSEVESRNPADCKGKAVALYQKMRSNGANVRLVIGKRGPTSRMTHTWLEWETTNGSFVLDPTFNYSATRAEKIRRNSYVPLYAYAGSKKFKAAGPLVAQN